MRSKRRAGAVLVLVAGMMIILLGFAAFAIDYGFAVNTRAQMQKATDAVTLAAINKWVESQNQQGCSAVIDLYMQENPVMGQVLQIEAGDVQYGSWDFDSLSFVSGTPNPNSVLIRLLKSEDGVNGPVETFFARVLNINSFQNVETTAVAALDNRLLSVPITANGGPLWPFSVDVNIVDANGDGMFDIGSEISFFPFRNQPGNFGEVDLNGGANSAAELSVWVRNGYNDPRGLYFPDRGEFGEFDGFPVQLEGHPACRTGSRTTCSIASTGATSSTSSCTTTSAVTAQTVSTAKSRSCRSPSPTAG